MKPVKTPNPVDDLNTYEGIARFYDVLMTNGYYDYHELTNALASVLGNRKKILELGVGTGLVVDYLLQKIPDLKITGVDNTKAMISQAQEKLGDRIDYVLEDIVHLALPDKFDAAFSVGGCWYFIDKGDHLEFCSHIDDKTACQKSLKNVVDHLAEGGVLTLALQGDHHNYSKKLSDELTYSQEIFRSSNGFTKKYSFTNKGGVVAEQHYSYLLLSQLEIHTLMSELGCEIIGMDPLRKFFTYQKR